MISGRRRKILVGGFVFAAMYCTLWLLTATWGIADVDHAFDVQFATGSIAFAGEGEEIPILRIDTLANARDLTDPANKFPAGTKLFRYRSHGVAIAPFLIVDEIATVFAPLGGFGGRRLNLWFFGFTKWWPIQKYWVA